MNPPKRKAWLKSHPRFLKHQSLTSLIVDGQVLAFPTIRRDEDLLVKNKPQIVLELEGEMAMQKLLLRMKSAADVKLIQIDVAVFAYEPILNALKSMRVLPLSAELLFWGQGSAPGLLTLPYKLKGVVDHVRSGADVGKLVDLPNQTILDAAQQRSLINGLTQKLSIIQGPPGEFYNHNIDNECLSADLQELESLSSARYSPSSSTPSPMSRFSLFVTLTMLLINFWRTFLTSTYLPRRWFASAASRQRARSQC